MISCMRTLITLTYLRLVAIVQHAPIFDGMLKEKKNGRDGQLRRNTSCRGGKDRREGKGVTGRFEGQRGGTVYWHEASLVAVVVALSM
jgi:hypothetical protein